MDKQRRFLTMTKVFKLELSEQAVQVIGAGLSELPYKHSAIVINEINKQIQAQLNNTAADKGSADKGSVNE